MYSHHVPDVRRDQSSALGQRVRSNRRVEVFDALAGPFERRLDCPEGAGHRIGPIRPRNLGPDLHGYFTYWYDARRRVTVIVYSCASAFVRLGETRDNFPALGAELERVTRNVRLRYRTGAPAIR